MNLTETVVVSFVCCIIIVLLCVIIAANRKTNKAPKQPPTGPGDPTIWRTGHGARIPGYYGYTTSCYDPPHIITATKPEPINVTPKPPESITVTIETPNVVRID